MRACKYFYILMFLCACGALLSTSANGQTLTQVSATITDPNGLPYSNASVVIQLVGGGSTPQTTPCAVSPCFVNNPPAIQTSAAGSFSIALWANGSITPGGTQWSFLVQEPGVAPPWGFGPKSFTYTATISGATDDISSGMSALAPALTPAFSGGATPCGSAGEIQYSAAPSLGCNANFTYTSASGLFKSANAGVFNNSQMNTYNVFTLNGCDPSAEYNYIQAGNFSSDAADPCAATPAGATVHQINGLGAYVNTSQNSSGGTVADTVGVYAQCRALVAGGGCWGINGGVSDGWPVVANSVAARMEAAEFDVWLENSASHGYGVQMVSQFTAQPGQSTSNGGQFPSIEIDRDGPGGVWTAGVACATGVTDNGSGHGDCVDIQAIGAGTGLPSQAIWWHSTNGTGGNVNGQLIQALTADFSPELQFVPATGLNAAFSAPTLITAGYGATLTGCGFTSGHAGGLAGNFASGTTGTCNITITMPVSTFTGWSCSATDITAHTAFLQTGTLSVTQAQLSGSTTSGDVVTYQCGGA